jgi:hypothetical protein
MLMVELLNKINRVFFKIDCVSLVLLSPRSSVSLVVCFVKTKRVSRFLIPSRSSLSPLLVILISILY